MLRRLDLVGVRGAHRGDAVRVHDAVKEEIDAAVLQLILMEEIARVVQPGVGDGVRAERALVGEVVDREERARLREEAIPPVTRLEREREEGGLPVVAVDDVGREAHALAHLERGTRQHEEAQVLVGICRVERRAMVDGRAVDEMNGRGARALGDEDVDRVAVRAEADLDVAQELLDVRALRVDRLVERHERADVVPGAAQVGRQRCGDVAQTTGFGVAGDLRGHEEDVHGSAIMPPSEHRRSR